MLKISKCNNINFFVNAGGKIMQKSLILIFRNRVQKYVYNFDIMAVDEKLNSSLVGYSMVNTSTGKVSIEISGELQSYCDLQRDSIRNNLVDLSFKKAKIIEEDIFANM